MAGLVHVYGMNIIIDETKTKLRESHYFLHYSYHKYLEIINYQYLFTIFQNCFNSKINLKIYLDN